MNGQRSIKSTVNLGFWEVRMWQMRKNYELELYKLLINPEEDDIDIQYVEEFGWVSNTEFYVWINLNWFNEFVKRLNDIFGYSLFDEGGIEARICSDCVCIDLEEVISGYGVDLEEIFPRSKYTH